MSWLLLKYGVGGGGWQGGNLRSKSIVSGSGDCYKSVVIKRTTSAPRPARRSSGHGAPRGSTGGSGGGICVARALVR